MRGIDAKHLRGKKPFGFNNTMRHLFLLTVFFVASIALIGRAVYWQYDLRLEAGDKNNTRYLRTVEVPAYHGSITDRHGTLLAVSAPVYSVWVDPLGFSDEHINTIADVLEIKTSELHAKIKGAENKRFLYIKRQIKPQIAESLRALKINGLHLDPVYKRFYPAGEITAHVVGLTDVDGRGIEGMEMNTDEHLRAAAGSKQIMIDAHKRTVRTVKLLEAPKDGTTLVLSIDQRIQYHAYRLLRNAVAKHNAESGSVVVVNAQTGEIIVAVNYPSFNPNDRRHNFSDKHRNRLVTDTFELGSTIKPIIMAAAIDGDYVEESMVINTAPGYYQLNSEKRVKDIKNYGKLDITGVISKSSNVGISKISELVPSEVLWTYLSGIGFGKTPGTIFPGERVGKLRHYTRWSPVDHKVMSFGYGVAVSTLQLAMAYTAFANDGWRPNPSFIKGNPYFRKQQVFHPDTAKVIRKMLQKAVSNDGTGGLAKIKGFTTAGKTGTTRKSMDDRGDANEYTSVFAGFAPVRQPNFVCVVVIDKPSRGDYYGGIVAAPVFSEVMSTTLRFMRFNYDESVAYDVSNALLPVSIKQ